MSGEVLRAELLAGLVGPTTKIYSRPANAGLGWRSAAEHPATTEWFDISPPPPD